MGQPIESGDSVYNTWISWLQALLVYGNIVRRIPVVQHTFAISAVTRYAIGSATDLYL